MRLPAYLKEIGYNQVNPYTWRKGKTEVTKQSNRGGGYKIKVSTCNITANFTLESTNNVESNSELVAYLRG